MELLEQRRSRPLPGNSGEGTIEAQREKYRCRGCYPAYLASKYHGFSTWTYTLSLSAPPGQFQEWWRRARILSVLEQAPRPRSVADLLAQPFWILVYAWQPGSVTAERAAHHRRHPGESDHHFMTRILPVEGDVYAHLVLGNVSEDLLADLIARWPDGGRFCVAKPITQERGGAWGALHYALSQTRIRRLEGESRAHYIGRVKWDHRGTGSRPGHDALCNVPYESDTLEIQDFVFRMRRATKKARSVTPETSVRMSRLARIRWDGERLIRAWRRERARKAV
jgi:hypothetical protein